MRSLFGISIASSVCALMLASSTTNASAHAPNRGGCCGPAAPHTSTKTIHPARYVTRYRDVSVVRHVTRIRHVTHVTQIQPIVHVSEVTRVHHHTIVHTRTAYRHVVEHLPPIVTVHHAVRNSYDCHCGR